MMHRFRAAGLLLFVWLAGSGTAIAGPISLAPNSATTFQVLWSKWVGTTELRALAEFTVAVTGDYLDFAVALHNQTSKESEKIHTIGFNIDPNATALTNVTQGTYFKNFELSQRFPGGFRTVDVCAWGTQNCTGGSDAANIPGGRSDSFGFRLLGPFGAGVTMGTFVVKFQGDPSSYSFEGSVEPPRMVPEPSTLLLMTLGACAAAASRRGRQTSRRG